MTPADPKRIIIVGAGLAGALMACYLAKMGYTVAVYERRPDPRAEGYIGGRSINLALSARGIKGLAGAGGELAETVLKDAIPMRGRMMHDRAGNTVFQPYSKNTSDAINSISRAGLNLTLLNAAAKHPNVSLHFDHRCLDVDLDAPAVVFEHEVEPAPGPGGKPKVQIVRAEADLVIGADGAFSAVRARMQKLDRFEYSQSYLEHGYKELHIPPVRATEGETEDGLDFALEPNALHIWPRGGSMMIALPNPDKSFTCTLFWPFEGPHGFANLKTPDHVERFFRTHYPDALPLMPTLVEDYLNNPTSSLVTVRCRPWHHLGGRGGTVLIGDAAHAIVPFYGQGMNAAFEDCLALAESLQRHHGDLTKALPEYQDLRKENADAIAAMALDNFIEMRDKVASRAFRARKHFEHALHALFPRSFMPLYNMVSFSTIPYAEARRRAERQNRVIGLAGMAAVGAVLALVVLGVRAVL